MVSTTCLNPSAPAPACTSCSTPNLLQYPCFTSTLQPSSPLPPLSHPLSLQHTLSNTLSHSPRSPARAALSISFQHQAPSIMHFCNKHYASSNKHYALLPSPSAFGNMPWQYAFARLARPRTLRRSRPPFLGLGPPPLSRSLRSRPHRWLPGASSSRPSGRRSGLSGLEASSRFAPPVAHPRAGQRRGHQRGARAVPLVLRARARATSQ